MKTIPLLFLIAFMLLPVAICDSLENVSDDDLVDMIKSDEFVIVLFCKRLFHFTAFFIDGNIFFL